MYDLWLWPLYLVKYKEENERCHCCFEQVLTCNPSHLGIRYVFCLFIYLFIYLFIFYQILSLLHFTHPSPPIKKTILAAPHSRTSPFQ